MRSVCLLVLSLPSKPLAMGASVSFSSVGPSVFFHFFGLVHLLLIIALHTLLILTAPSPTPPQQTTTATLRSIMLLPSHNDWSSSTSKTSTTIILTKKILHMHQTNKNNRKRKRRPWRKEVHHFICQSWITIPRRSYRTLPPSGQVCHSYGSGKSALLYPSWYYQLLKRPFS